MHVAWFLGKEQGGKDFLDDGADSRECQQDAWQEANSRYLDRTYLYGGRWVYPDPLGRPLIGYPYAPFADFCMRAKGYELTETGK